MQVKGKTPLEKYLNLPEKYPAELLEGEIVMVPSPGRKHQKVSGEIFNRLFERVENGELGEVYYEFDVKFDEENVLRPDIVFVSKERLDIIKDNWIEGAPDMVVEVLSPTSATRDLIVERDVYEKFGVREYWVVDPVNEEVFVFVLKEKRYILRCHGKKCDSLVLENFSWGFE